MRVLTINTGSSSLKAGIYDVAPPPACRESLEFSATASGIGEPDGELRVLAAVGQPRVSRKELRLPLPSHGEAFREALAALRESAGAASEGMREERIAAVGHRIVAAGAQWDEARPITPALLAELQSLVPLAPDHLPQALAAIRGASAAFPRALQIACSDSTFHRTLPAVARYFAVPRSLREKGLVRCGFHGLSCEYVIAMLRAIAPAEAAGRVVVAHLGNGASMTAVRGGQSIDTTMGLTPLGGLPMSTRSGDLDPGLLLHLLQQEGLSPAALNTMLNRDSGLRGISALSGDMKVLLEQSPSHPPAAEAVAFFVYQTRKFLAALAAALGGLDTLIFTGGIGENSPAIRGRICEGMDWLGIRLDAARNERQAAVISADTSSIVVRVLPTDEDRMIARHAARALATGLARAPA